MTSPPVHGQVSSSISCNSDEARKNPEDFLDKRHGVEEQERIYVYVEAVSKPLNLYATNGVIAKTTAEVKAFKQRASQTAVSFARALKDKALRCRGPFSEHRTMSIFVEGLPRNVRDNKQLYRAARPTMHLCQLGQYADTLMQLKEDTPSLSTKTRNLSHCDQATHAVSPEEVPKYKGMRVPEKTTQL